MTKARDRGEQVTIDLSRSRARQRTPVQAKAWLLIYHADGAEAVPLRRDSPVVLGRAVGADFIVRDPAISRRHVSFELRAEGVQTTDLGSRNGTRVNGAPFRGGLLKPGDEVLLGATSVTIHARESSNPVPLGMLSHDRFVHLLTHESLRARSLGGLLGLIVVATAEGQGARLRALAPQLRQLLKPSDLCALYAADRVELGLLQSDRDAVRALAQQAVRLGEPEPGAASALRCGIALLPGMAGSAEELVAAAHAAVIRATAERPIALAPELTSEHPSVQLKRPTAERLAAAPVVACQVMTDLYQLARTVATSNIPVLITGETGVGKEVLARQIHERSPRRKQAFQALNCGAVPAGLVESTLFGHERGAFTGANREAKGVFEAAHGGTLFLDEIGELPAAAQAALLRVLERGEVLRVGATRPRPVDVRVVTATHRDLESMCAAGEFRSDLLFRLNAVVLDVPPLRLRREEIVPLAESFAESAGRSAGKQIEGLTPAAEQLVTAYAWPGNIRQLRNVIERAVCLCEGELIDESALPEALRALRGPQMEEQPTGVHELEDQRLAGLDFKTRIQRVEEQLILEALRRCDWNQTKAAALLKIPQRTLTRKIQGLGIKKLGYGAAERPDDG